MQDFYFIFKIYVILFPAVLMGEPWGCIVTFGDWSKAYDILSVGKFTSYCPFCVSLQVIEQMLVSKISCTCYLKVIFHFPI